MKTAVVILNYNGKGLLEKFLPSVVKNSSAANIYVIDNASTDDSIDFISVNYPEIGIITNNKNYGYASGYNIGLKRIDEDILCLLNSDVEVTEDWLNPILGTFERKPEVAIVQPKILDYQNPDRFEYAGAAGGFIDTYGFPYCRGRIFDHVENDNGQYDDEREIFWASGACFFIRNNVFRDLNGFDDSFFAHMEEIDLCWRAFNNNLKSYVNPDSIVFHLGGGTLNYGTPRKTFLNFRNSLYMLVKNVPGNLFRILYVRLTYDVIAFFKMMLDLKPLHAMSILRAHFYFYFFLPKYLMQRKRINNPESYFSIKSIVWAHFVNKIKTFDCL